MTDREKLIELIDDFVYNIDVKRWYSEEHDEGLADHLIAHGVTFAKDNNVLDKWIPVTERLPNYNTFVIVFAEGIVGEAVLDDANYWYWAGTDEYASKIKVTHWMHLPQPPKGE